MSRLSKPVGNYKPTQWQSLIQGFCLSTLIVSSSVLADDTEVFYGQVASSIDTDPNVLIVLDTSSSMNGKDKGDLTRLQRMKNGLVEILDTATNVNIGIMRLNGSGGGGAVIAPIKPRDSLVCDGDCGIVNISSQVATSLGDVEEHLHTNGIANDAKLLLGSTGVSGHNHAVGFQFKNIGIPTGATIVNAQIEFTANSTDTTEVNLLISAEAADNATVFDSSTASVSGRSDGTPLSWAPGEWTTNETYKTPNVNAQIQEIVDRPGWCGGNAINLLIKNDGAAAGKRYAQSFDHSTANAPVLRITYDSTTVPATGVCTTKLIVASLLDGDDDDAEERVGTGRTNGRMYRDSSDLQIPYEDHEQIVGLRFPEMEIPQGATITSADIQFTVDEYKTGDVTIDIEAEDSNNAAAFKKTKSNISDRSRTAAESWVNPPLESVDRTVVTPSLIDQVQQVVNRSGWLSGNAMAFIFSKTSGSGTRVYVSRNKSSSKSAKLRVRFQSTSGTSTSSSPAIITAREQMKQIVNEIKYTSGAPIVGAYYEAALYMRGENVDYGKERGSSHNRVNRVSHSDTYGDPSLLYQPPGCTNANLGDAACKDEVLKETPKYISPMASSCQTNQIILLSDGEPTSTSPVAKIQSIMGYKEGERCTNDSGSDACARDFAGWLYDTDHSSSLSGKQNIATYSIGFNFDGGKGFLQDVANLGGGQFLTAESSTDLVGVLDTILGQIAEVDTSFVSAGATVNQFNRLTHRDDLYFAVFKPSKQHLWNGNLKRYNVGEDDDDNILIMDDSNPPKPAVDADSGFFHDESRSAWLADTDPADGNSVGMGGAAHKQELTGIPDIGDRNVYTYVSGGLPATLSSASNKLHEDTPAITEALLAITTLESSDIPDYRENIIQWARGIDVRDVDADGNVTEVRKHMGDPMHSRPVIVNYASGATDPHSVVFVGTNEGFLHAINTEDGHEQYSFIPPELLKNLKKFYENNPVPEGERPYGLDGSITLWASDVNGNVTIDAEDEAYLFLGMRRGGNNYYAMDITERLNPKLAWVVQGGSTGFEDLGQSWSKPIPSKIKINGVSEEVVIFAGGYDEDEDPVEVILADGNRTKVKAQSESTTTKGRAIYIVRAKTGEKLWSITHDDSTGDQKSDKLLHSIPSDIRVIDVDFDGFVDQMYVGDIGGQVWRFDVNDANTGASNLFDYGVIADLSGSTADNQRRFFYEPDVAMVGYEGERFLTISIGSGWRARPLDEVTQDRIYVMRSTDIHNKPAYYGKKVATGASFAQAPITESDLVNVTSNLDPTINQYGWFIDLGGSGEKILSRSVTFDNQVFLTSYKPGESVGACSTAIGSGSIYVMNVINGKPVIDMDNDHVEETDDRKLDLNHGGIPPDPNILIADSSNGPTPIVMAGAEKFKFNFDGLTKRTFWVDLGQD